MRILNVTIVRPSFCDSWRQIAPMSQFSMGAGQQLSLFGQEESARHRQLDQAMDEIRDRFGDGVISRGGVKTGRKQ